AGSWRLLDRAIQRMPTVPRATQVAKRVHRTLYDSAIKQGLQPHFRMRLMNRLPDIYFFRSLGTLKTSGTRASEWMMKWLGPTNVTHVKGYSCGGPSTTNEN